MIKYPHSSARKGRKGINMWCRGIFSATILFLLPNKRDHVVSGLLRPTFPTISLGHRRQVALSLLESPYTRALALALTKKAKNEVDGMIPTTSENADNSIHKGKETETGNDDKQKSRLKDGMTSLSTVYRQLVSSVRLLHLRYADNTNAYNIPADRDTQWDYFYQMFLTADILTRTDVRQSILRTWCAEQRKSYMKTLGMLDTDTPSNWGMEYLTRERKERLDLAEFDWGHLKHVGSDDLVYSEKYQRIVREMYRDSKLTKGYQDIAMRNAKQYRENGVTDVPFVKGNTIEQKKALSEILSNSVLKSSVRYYLDEKDKDIASDKEVPLKGERKAKKNIIPWSQRIEDLEIFAEEHGHCNVPLDFEEDSKGAGKVGLGMWVKRQKDNKKLSLKSQRVLEDLGFEFNFKTM